MVRDTDPNFLKETSMPQVINTNISSLNAQRT